MTHAELYPDQDEMWRMLFDEQHADLAIVAKMLLRHSPCPETVLRKALKAVEDSSCEVAFGHAVRAVVETAVACNRETADAPALTQISAESKLRVPGLRQIAILPWPQRAVYFLRGVLRYSCQETALLFGMTEPQIDLLYELAVKRIAY